MHMNTYNHNSTLFLFLIACLSSCLNPQQTTSPVIKSNIDPSPCDGCEYMFHNMPETLTSTYTVPHDLSKFTELHITGRVIAPPSYAMKDIVVYFYHTDPQGLYSGGETSHGALRGWVQPDETGRYEIITALPGCYPNREEPAHIHYIIKEKEKPPYWIDNLCFDHDPFYVGEKKNNRSQRGGSGTTRIDTSDSIWHGIRDIYLGQNIPGHPLEKHNAAPCLNLQSGEDMISFPMQHILGPDYGKYSCPLCSFRHANPGILIYIQDTEQPSVIDQMVEMAEELQADNVTAKVSFIIREDAQKALDHIRAAYENRIKADDIKAYVGTIPIEANHPFSSYGSNYNNSFAIEYQSGKAEKLFCEIDQFISTYKEP